MVNDVEQDWYSCWPDGLFESHEVLALLGYSQKLVDTHRLTKLWSPAVSAMGSGNRNRWTAWDVVAVAALLEIGTEMSPSRVGLARYLRQAFDDERPFLVGQGDWWQGFGSIEEAAEVAMHSGGWWIALPQLSRDLFC